ncbi:MAG: TRAM domain-containing protein [Candidatus Aenigmatarchaeota archaeon]
MPRFERRGFKKFGQRIDLPKPIKVGEEYDVEINEVGSRGDGIARIKNFVVFVGNTKKGEKAHIKIKEVRNRFAIGEKVGKAEEGAEEPKEEPEVPEEEPTEEEPEETEEPEEVPGETEEETEV